MKSFFSVLALFAWLPVGADGMTVRLPLMRTPPLVDGVVSPDEWAAADGSFGFVRYRTAVAEPIRSAFYIGRTRDRLFVAGLGEIGPGGLKRENMPRAHGAGSCGTDDTYEIVFVPDTAATSPDIRHLTVNFNGAWQTQARLGGNMSAWHPETFVSRSTEKDGFWHFECSISLAEIGFDTASAGSRGIRLCRNFKNVYDQWGVQTSMRAKDGAFFSDRKTVPVVFDDSAVAVQLHEVPTTDRARWAVRLDLCNPTEKTLEVDARVSGRPDNSQPGVLRKKLTLRPGERLRCPVSGPASAGERVDISVDVVQRGRSVFRRSFVWRPGAPPPRWLLPGGKGSVRFDFAYFPSYDKLRVRVDLSSIEKRPPSVKLELRNDADRGRDLLAERRFTLDHRGRVDEIWEIPDLKAETLRTGVGGYTLTLTADSVKDGRVVKSFRRDVFPWEGFAGGRSDTIPSMFEPIKEYRDGFLGLFGDRHVKTVLKDHVIGAFGLWKQVTAAGKDILARPIRLVTASGEPPPGESVRVKTSWDVDGMMLWECTLRPGRYEPLSLEIPVRGERAPLLHACTDGLRFNYGGVVPPGRGCVWDSSMATRRSIIGDYVPYVWIGGPLRGISVFGENDKGWVTDPAGRCQQIVREEDGTVVLRLNLVQKPVDVTAARTITIGFLATPVKPMEKNWRSKPIGYLMGSCFYWGGATASDEISPYDGTDAFWRKMAEARRTGRIDTNYIERAIGERVCRFPTNSSSFAARYKLFKNHYYAGMRRISALCGTDGKHVWYTNGRGVRLGNEAGTTFADEWTVEPFLSRPFGFYETKSYSLDPCASYLDYAAYWWEKALSLGVVDYYYWDDIFCQSNFDPVGTAAYRLPDGAIQPASGIFNQRAQVRRCAVLQAERGWPDNKNWVHMTNTALAPVLSFAGTNYDWEDVAGGDSALQERYSRESIQAQSLGRQFGNQVAIMGYFSTSDKQKLKWLRRTGLGLALTHELQWRLVDDWKRMDRRLTDWGYRDPETRVWNYWDEDVPFPVTVEGGVCASLAMTRTDGEALLVVSDFRDGGAYTFRPDCASLGVRPDFTAVDFETGRALPVVDGGVRVRLSRFDFVIVKLK